MPSGYLHMRCARQACELASITPVETDVMLLGAQGPDPLFMLGIFPLRLSSKPSKLGNRLHSYRTGAFLRCLCRRAREGDQIDRAYALGFLTHYALDSTVHPYVYAQSYDENGKYSSIRHTSLEKQWDAIFFRREGHTGTPLLMPGVAQTKAHWAQIATLWQGAIHEVFPEEQVTVAMIEKALQDADRANRLTHSPHGIKYATAWALERVIGKPGLATSQIPPRFPTRKEILNENGQAWHSPFDPEMTRNETVGELLDTASALAAKLLTAAQQYFDDTITEEAFAAIIGNRGYDSGLPSPDNWERTG